MPTSETEHHGSDRSDVVPKRFRSRLLAGVAMAPLWASRSLASEGSELLTSALGAVTSNEVVLLAMSMGLVVFGVSTAIALIRARGQLYAHKNENQAAIAEQRARADRMQALLLSEPQALIVWGQGDDIEIEGDTALIADVPVARRILAFGSWLPHEQAAKLEQATDRLRQRGEPLRMLLTSLKGRHVEAIGQPVEGRAVLRLVEVSGTRRDLADLTARNERMVRDVESLKALIEALPYPIWSRDGLGNLAWVNPAYAQAVDAPTTQDAVQRGTDLLDRSVREAAQRIRARGEVYIDRVAAVMAGHRRMLQVFDLPTQRGSAAIGIDVTEVEALKSDLDRRIEANRRTLDLLSTGVAIFEDNGHLAFYNTAYSELWSLDASFLDQHPSDNAILDRLRAGRKLPEQADFKAWRAQLHEGYRTNDAREHWWHLPDNRTIRVITTPNPEGGVTYLMDDATERIELERRFDALIHVQGETLDNLEEGVAVFGSDGRLGLHNPAFARLWKLSPTTLAERPHVEAVAALCKPLHPNEHLWAKLRAAVTGLDRRDPLHEQILRADGSAVELVTQPLPDGATLTTFRNVTDTVNVERALRERAEALEAADKLRNDFIHHVSYELRSPLTNIIGFAQLLDDPGTGDLNAKQREYLDYITGSSAALLALIDDILDLASIDAGGMELSLGAVDIRATMEAAAEGLRDRLTEKHVQLALRASADIGSFEADGARVRQILFNLLSNAVGFSSEGATVTLSARRDAHNLIFTVHDNGPGIPADRLPKVFGRFETHTSGSRHRGIGLGLSIVQAFVELHGGVVKIESLPTRGTTVTCVFPLQRGSILTLPLEDDATSIT